MGDKVPLRQSNKKQAGATIPRVICPTIVLYERQIRNVMAPALGRMFGKKR
jgi:hypothetical protein